MLSKIKIVTLSILLVIVLGMSFVAQVQAQPLKTIEIRSEIMTQSSDQSHDKKDEKADKQETETPQVEAKEAPRKRPYGVVPPGGYYDEASGITYFEGENIIVP